jgi:hypothetical protein
VDYKSLTSKQKVAFHLKIALRKHYQGYRLTNFKDEVNHDPEALGTHVQVLPNCLDPNQKEKRVIKGQEMPDSLCKLAEIIPIEFQFYPS